MVKHIKYWILIALMGLALNSAWAMQAIMWQPQERDLNIADDKWVSLMQQLQQQGFDHLVLQWTRYGDSLNSPQQIEQLQHKAHAAHQAGLRLIVGLYADSDFFNLQKQPTDALTTYLEYLGSQELQQVAQWANFLGIEPEGWYISAEIDDLNWRSEQQQQILQHWLEQLYQLLGIHEKKESARSRKPVYISSFFAGNMSPSSYQDLIQKIRKIGYQVWIQDGRGVGSLSTAQQRIYLNHSVACLAHKPSLATGIIYEIFQMDQNTDSFKAVPASGNYIEQLLNNTVACPSQRVYFSLRYLPISQGILASD